MSNGGGGGAGKLGALVVGGLVVGAIGGLALLGLGIADESNEQNKRRRRRIIKRGRKGQGKEHIRDSPPEFLTAAERQFLRMPSVPNTKTELQKRAFDRQVDADMHGAYWLECITAKAGDGNKSWLSTYGAIYEKGKKQQQAAGAEEEMGETPSIVRRDLHRTYPSSILFKDREIAAAAAAAAAAASTSTTSTEDDGGAGGPTNHGQQELEGVLLAYARFDPEVSYVQGMNFIVGLLLHNMGPRQAFAVLLALMKENRCIQSPSDEKESGRRDGANPASAAINSLVGPGYGMRNLFTPEMPLLHIRFFQLRELMKIHLPALSAHFDVIGLTPIIYANEWFLTIFTYVYDAEDVVGLWDIFFCDGVPALFRFGMAILKSLEQRLLMEQFDGCIQILKGFGRSANLGGEGEGVRTSVNSIIKLSHTFQITNEHLDMLSQRINVRYFQLEKLMQLHVPHISSHLRKYYVEPRHFAASWFTSFFSDSIDNCEWIWTHFEEDGFVVLMRIALAILSMKCNEILGQNSFEGCTRVIRSFRARNMNGEDIKGERFDVQTDDLKALEALYLSEQV